jgi:hypothetical protein
VSITTWLYTSWLRKIFQNASSTLANDCASKRSTLPDSMSRRTEAAPFSVSISATILDFGAVRIDVCEVGLSDDTDWSLGAVEEDVPVSAVGLVVIVADIFCDSSLTIQGSVV